MHSLPIKLTCQQCWHTSNENRNNNGRPLGCHVSLPSVKHPLCHHSLLRFVSSLHPTHAFLSSACWRTCSLALSPRLKSWRMWLHTCFVLALWSRLLHAAWCFEEAHTEEINHNCRCLLSPLSFSYHTHLPKTHREIVWLLLYQGHLP